jgi:hypothetical protein
MSEHQLQTSLERIEEALERRSDAQDEVLEKLDHAVNGNGKVGLTTRVDRIERFLAILTRVGWILFAAFITELMAGVAAAIVWIIRGMGH